MGAMMNECADCHRDRPPLEAFGGGVMDYIHGNYVMLCRRCVLIRQLAHARESAERIPELEAALAAMD